MMLKSVALAGIVVSHVFAATVSAQDANLEVVVSHRLLQAIAIDQVGKTFTHNVRDDGWQTLTHSNLARIDKVSLHPRGKSSVDVRVDAQVRFRGEMCRGRIQSGFTGSSAVALYFRLRVDPSGIRSEVSQVRLTQTKVRPFRGGRVIRRIVESRFPASTIEQVVASEVNKAIFSTIPTSRAGLAAGQVVELTSTSEQLSVFFLTAAKKRKQSRIYLGQDDDVVVRVHQSVFSDILRRDARLREVSRELEHPTTFLTTFDDQRVSLALTAKIAQDTTEHLTVGYELTDGWKLKRDKQAQLNLTLDLLDGEAIAQLDELKSLLRYVEKEISLEPEGMLNLATPQSNLAIIGTIRRLKVIGVTIDDGWITVRYGLHSLCSGPTNSSELQDE